MISYFENFGMGISKSMYWNSEDNRPHGFFLSIDEYAIPIKRFINSLNDFKKNEDTYTEPDKYLEMLKASIAAEINNEIKYRIKEKEC